MKQRDYRDYLQDIIDSISEVETFIQDITFDDFSEDRKTINAVIRSIEVIGEATKKIPEFIRERDSSIPWKKMAGMRDKMIHEYSGVDIEILWKVADEDLPSLKPLVQKVLKNLGE